MQRTCPADSRPIQCYVLATPMLLWSGDREYTEPELARKMLEQAPFTPIAAMEENVLGRIRGTVLPFRDLGVLIAPVSGRSCVGYLLHVQRLHFGVTQHWGERWAAPFVMLDDGQRAVVDPAYAYLRVRYEPVATRYGFAGCTDVEQALLTRLGVPRDGFHRVPPQYVFQEARIEPGHRVTVYGSGVREPDPQADPSMYRGGPPTRLMVSGSPNNPIAVSTDPDLLA